MIINDLIGGLGNQLFQISAGFAHAKKIQTEYGIVIYSRFKQKTVRK